MPITTDTQMEMAIEALPGIPIDKRLTVLRDVYEYMLTGDPNHFMEVVNGWNENPNYVSAIEQIPIEARQELLTLALLKIVYKITKENPPNKSSEERV